MKKQTKAEKLADYGVFVEKFKPKLTTDDCYTPEKIYQAVASHAQSAYGVGREKMIRPFWPGADYKAHEYGPGAVVVDNPPFSILSEIVDHYLASGVKFFLFAPALTALNYTTRPGITAVISNSKIIYDNGADVITAFLTNLSPELVAVTAPALNGSLNQAIKEIAASKAKQLPRYEYPINLVTAAMLKSAADTEIRIERARAHHLRSLDEQRAAKKAVFGCGLLVPDEIGEAIALAIKNKKIFQAEKEVSNVWKLSQRELDIIEKL